MGQENEVTEGILAKVREEAAAWVADGATHVALSAGVPVIVIKNQEQLSLATARELTVLFLPDEIDAVAQSVAEAFARLCGDADPLLVAQGMLMANQKGQGQS